MTIEIRAFRRNDLSQMIAIWNEIIEEGNAFPQEEILGEDSGFSFFSDQTFCAVAEDRDEKNIVGLYILHPNNIGRCGHIANASYAIASSCRGLHIGEKLVLHCIEKAKEVGFKVLQFNAVVQTNQHARHLYERLNFTMLGTIPEGFRMKDGRYEAICLYYLSLCTTPHSPAEDREKYIR